MRAATLLAVLAAAWATPAAAQTLSTAPAVGAPALGQPLSVSGGPWVLAETLFFSGGRVVSDYAWRDKLHGITGQLYTAADLQSDVQTLTGLKVFSRVTPAV